MDNFELEEELVSCRQRLESLRAELAQIGPVTRGSLGQVFNRGHGPYWQWTAKVEGKTVCRRVTGRALDIYREYTDNSRKLRGLVQQVYETSERMLALELTRSAEEL
jgi:hypothetical protein